MSYALDIGILGGPACTVPHRVLERIRAAFDAHADRMRSWRVICPLGTDISGTQDPETVACGNAANFTLTRYPVCASRPLPCDTASGVVALNRWLIASGNRKYDNDELLLADPVLAHVESGRIVDFTGPGDKVDAIRVHYRQVGAQFGMDPFTVHSWHAGINPGAYYPIRAGVKLERWDKVAFANPRYLHFHTCGDYAPGEICWGVFDASAELDGIPFWRDGAFVFLDSAEVRTILADEGLAQLELRRDIGID